MDNETFWTLIERSRHEEAVPAERLEWLMTTVAKLPVPEIVGFQACLEDARLPLDSWELWAAADRILGGYCSDDGFWYFQAWVIGLGRAAYEAVVADPDSLAEIRELRQLAGRPDDHWSEEEWPDWEGLDYVATEAFEEQTGEDEDAFEELLIAAGVDGPASPDPTGERWDVKDEAEAARRLPRLSVLFPLNR